jgi:hypothetical protein
MNLWLMAIGQQLTYLYDQDIQDRQMQEDIMKQIQVRFATSPVDEVSNAEAIHEWDYGGNE